MDEDRVLAALTALSTRFDDLSARFDDLSARVNGLSARVDGFGARLDQLHEEVISVRTSVMSRVDLVQEEVVSVRAGMMRGWIACRRGRISCAMRIA